MMRAVVTGGCGFIGSELVRQLLAARVEVHVLDARFSTALGWDEQVLLLGDRLTQLDVTDAQAVETALMRIKPCVVFHLAAQSHVDESIRSPAGTIDSNATGTFNVARACAKARCAMLYCSTDEVYGDAEQNWHAWTESASLAPSSPYSASKAAGELFVRAVARTYGLRFAITRGTNAFGPGQYPEKLVPIACRLLQRGERVPLHGGGYQIRQWIHVSEFAQALMRTGVELAANNSQIVGSTLNIAGPVRVSVRDLVQMLAERLGVPAEQAFEDVEDRPGGDFNYKVSGSFAASALGFRANRMITDGSELDALLRHYGSNGRCELALYERSA